MTNLITRLNGLGAPHKSTYAVHKQVAADVLGLVPEKRVIDEDSPLEMQEQDFADMGFNNAIDQVVRGLTDYLASSLEPERKEKK